MRLSLLALVVLAACTDPALESATSESIVLTDDNSFVVEIAQAGAFSDLEVRSAQRIHYGFTSKHGFGWEATGDILVEYHEHDSLPVEVRVPNDHAESLLSFVVFSGGKGTVEVAGADQFIPLDAHEGTMVRLPVFAGASYPFGNECYTMQVRDQTDEGNFTYFPGKPLRTYYGFTKASFDVYEKQNDLPWQNSVGAHVADGFSQARFAHDGGYKGSYQLLSDWVRVPAGQNLVFKVQFEKFGGICWNSNDTWLQEVAATQTYFVAP